MYRNFSKLTIKIFIVLVLITQATLSCLPPIFSQSNIPIENTKPNVPLNKTITPVMSSTPKPLEPPREETDGQLTLVVKKTNNKCYSPGDTIPLVFTFKNISEQAFKIADYDVLSIHPLIGGKGQVYPFVFNQYNEKIITPEHLIFVQVANMEETKVYTLDAGEYFDTLVENYVFPLKIIAVDDNGENQEVSIPAGTYLIQFRYISSGSDSYWQGLISSNVVDVCIK